MDTKTIASRMRIAKWLADERREYADKKYDPDGDSRKMLVKAMENEGMAVGSTWDVFVTNYLARVYQFGVETEQGRQALGKLVVTLTHALETAEVVFGEMPMPGLSSGDMKDWT